jgi:glycerol uptake facilitator protein
MVTADYFASFPRSPVLGSVPACIFDVFASTTFFSCMVFAMWDPRNLGARRELGSIFMGLAILAIGLAFGYNTGFPINPAQDFAPR